MWHFDECELFASLPREDAEGIIQKFTRQHMQFKKGAIIYNENDPNDFVYLVKSGSVCLSKYMRDGKQITLSLLRKDTLFGDGDVLNEQLYTHSAQTVEATKVCYIPKSDFVVLLNKYDSLRALVMSMLYKQLREAQSQIELLAINDIKGRLLVALSRFSQKLGDPIPGQEGYLNLPLNMSQEKLADYIGTSRESINRILHELRDTGALEITSRHALTLTPLFSEMVENLSI